MIAVVVLLGVTAVAGVAATVWALLARAKVQAALAGAERELLVTQQSLAAARQAAARDDAEGRGLRQEVTELRSRLDAERDAHAKELSSREEVFAEKQRHHEALQAEHERRVGELNQKFENTFRSLAAAALSASTQDFLRLARERFEADRTNAEGELDKRLAAVDALVKPIADTLEHQNKKLADIALQHTGEHAGLLAQLKDSGVATRQLQTEAARLVQALRKPEVRGRWGEVQLERVVEIAGMKNYCDAARQESTRDADGRLLKPDMIIRLPNGRVVAVDAKTNIDAYMAAIDADTPDQSEACLGRFAQHVADQVAALSRKEYWRHFDGSHELVVMFIPGDQFVDAALQRQPQLFEKATAANIILASPSTLIGLLRAIAMGWRERRLEDEARELQALGKQLYERACTFAGHLGALSKSLEGAVASYNKATSSFNERLMPTLRKFEGAVADPGTPLFDPPEIVVRPSAMPANP